MKFIPNTDQDRQEMLEFLGVKSIKELFKNIPEELLLKKNLKIPRDLSEIELVREMRLLSGKNADLEHYSCLYREVVKTYAQAKNLKNIEVGYENGITSLEELKEKISNKTAAVLIQNPNFFGSLENLGEIEEIIHKNKSLFIVAIVEPTSLGLLKPPGELGADIVVGEGQSFGNPISFGGPHLGFMATKDKYMRKLPGRLVGATKDSKGRRGYILTLQAREQHIRREKATSNICTNQALCALAATIYLVSLGKRGLRKVAELSTQKAHYAFEKIKEIDGFEEAFASPFYNEFIVECNDAKGANRILLKEKIIGPLELEKYYPELKNHLLFCTTEMNSKEEIDRLVNILRKTR